MNEAARRIGIFGGTFDPVHNTHIDVARAALEQARLDCVLFMVAGQPPHKDGRTFASAEDRFDMVQAALTDLPSMEPCRIELDRTGPSYTVETLDTLEDLYPGREFFLLIGFDSLVDLPKWKNPQGILSRVRLLVVPRPGCNLADIPAVLAGHYDLLSFEESALSSTAIRERIRAGECVRGMAPEAVEQLLRERGIYRDGL